MEAPAHCRGSQGSRPKSLLHLHFPNPMRQCKAAVRNCYLWSFVNTTPLLIVLACLSMLFRTWTDLVRSFEVIQIKYLQHCTSYSAKRLHLDHRMDDHTIQQVCQHGM